MSESNVSAAFEAFVIRYVHDVVTGESINIGTVLSCPQHRFLEARWATTWRRVRQAFPDADRVMLTAAKNAWERHFRRRFTRDELFVEQQWKRPLEFVLYDVFPKDFAQLQLGPGMAGVTRDPRRTLEDLHARHVQRHHEPTPEKARSENDVWRDFALKLGDAEAKLQLRVLHGAHNVELACEHSWKNGVWNAVLPLSFDLVDEDHIRDKAARWVGRLVTVRPWEQQTKMAFLVALPTEGARLRAAARDATAILSDELKGRDVDVVLEDRADALARRILDDLESHGDERSDAD